MIISVIIITRNRPNLLRRAIDSVVQQKTTNEIEILVVDDASHLDNEIILREFVDINITYFKFDNNVGANKARNKGGEMAKGEFIAFLDDDDEWAENKIERQLREINYCQNTLVYTGKDIILSKNEEVLSSRYSFKVPYFAGNLKKSIRVFNFIGTTSTILMSRNMFFKINGFDEDMIALQDYELYIRIIDSGYNVVGVNEGLIKYYEFSDKKNISNSFKKNLTSCLQILKINSKKQYFHIFLLSIVRIFISKVLKSLKSRF